MAKDILSEAQVIVEQRVYEESERRILEKLLLKHKTTYSVLLNKCSQEKSIADDDDKVLHIFLNHLYKHAVKSYHEIERILNGTE